MQTLNKTQKTTPCFKLDEFQAKEEVVRAESTLVHSASLSKAEDIHNIPSQAKARQRSFALAAGGMRHKSMVPGAHMQIEVATEGLLKRRKTMDSRKTELQRFIHYLDDFEIEKSEFEPAQTSKPIDIMQVDQQFGDLDQEILQTDLKTR